MLIGNNDNRLIYLDTNAIREIVLNNDNSLKTFLEKFVVGENKYAPVFSNNLFELKPYEDIYTEFLTCFQLFLA